MSDTLKIAFATDDRKTIASHTGRAKEFVIFHIAGKSVQDTVYYTNSQAHPHEHSQHKDHEPCHNEHHEHRAHHHGHSHNDIVEKLKDADLLYYVRMGKHLRESLDASGIKHEMTSEQNIDTIVTRYIS